MNDNAWLDLQLFAGEGAGEGGGEGADTGVEAVDPGRQRLLELGVPADKIRNRSYKAAAKATEGEEIPSGAEQKPKEQDDAADPTEEKVEATEKRKSFQELLEDPEYNGEMQKIVQARLRSAKGAEDALKTMAPAFEVLAIKHGLDPNNIDYKALSQAIHNDETYYEDKALEMGVDIDEARRLVQKERSEARQQRQESVDLREQMIRDHVNKVKDQAAELKKLFPGFDLQKEMKDPRFVRMTAPGSGLSVQDAYYAIHREELQMATAQATFNAASKKISNAIQSGARRPAENGTSAQAPSVTTFDYSKASKAQRDAFKEHLRREAAQGRKVYPGGYQG